MSLACEPRHHALRAAVRAADLYRPGRRTSHPKDALKPGSHTCCIRSPQPVRLGACPPPCPAVTRHLAAAVQKEMTGKDPRESLPLSYLHIDCDLYAGSRDALTLLSHKIVPGTVLLFDELVNYNTYREHEVGPPRTVSACSSRPQSNSWWPSAETAPKRLVCAWLCPLLAQMYSPWDSWLLRGALQFRNRAGACTSWHPLL